MMTALIVTIYHRSSVTRPSDFTAARQKCDIPSRRRVMWWRVGREKCGRIRDESTTHSTQCRFIGTASTSASRYLLEVRTLEASSQVRKRRYSLRASPRCRPPRAHSPAILNSAHSEFRTAPVSRPTHAPAHVAFPCPTTYQLQCLGVK